MDKKRYQCASQLNINWGRGRLNRHESFFGFAAKFCRLNCLKPKQFREFWKSLFVNHENRLNYMARMLDEPLPVVKTVFCDRFIDWSRLTYELNNFNINFDKITFCPECIAEGYHGNFHESTWLKKCPIHRIDLASEDISYSVIFKLDRYIVKLLSLLDLKCPGWETLDGKYSSRDSISQNIRFMRFLDWRRATESNIKNHHTFLAAFGCNTALPYFPFCQFVSDHDQLMIMIKLGLAHPMEDDLCELFVDSVLNTNVEIICFFRDNTNILKKISGLFNYGDLFDLFIFVNSLRCEPILVTQLVKNEIDKVKLTHEKCNCCWGIFTHGGLVKCLPGELKYYSNCLCPYEYAAKELNDKWLKLSQDDSIFTAENWIRYGLLAHRANDIGMTSVVGYTTKERKPILVFNWPDQINDALNVILEKIVIANIEELRNWLSSIDTGNAPNLRERFGPNIYLVQNQDLDLQLISWPPRKTNRGSHLSDRLSKI